MNSYYEELAKTIRKNAKHVIDSKSIETILGSIGELFYTGSYALDLMTWNDIDMQLVLKNGADPINTLGGVFNHFSKDEDFIEAQMIHFKGGYKPKMPRGVYLGLKLNCPQYGDMWKLDLWVLSKEDFEKNRSLINLLQSKLDTKTRQLILELKHEMMNGNGRVPQMGSHALYQAILLEEIKDKEQLYNHFANLGFAIKK